MTSTTATKVDTMDVRVPVTLRLSIVLESIPGLTASDFYVYVISGTDRKYVGLVVHGYGTRPWSFNCSHRLGHDHPAHDATYVTRRQAVMGLLAAALDNGLAV